ncbi:MAG: ribonuclease J [Leptospiraceae bacterium]|nr:ribonuclease J [Leptospiraceae bacterium]
MVPQVSSDPAGIVDYPRRLAPGQLYFAFGGGVGKFGTNFTVFHYAAKNSRHSTTIWIDAGAGFASHQTPGMERSLPNRQLLLGFPPTAIFLTHGHEDHIGAMPHLVQVIPKGTPIFASPFTAALLTARLEEHGIDPRRWDFQLIEEDSSIEIGNFRIETFFMPHSIPQCFSVGIETNTASGKKRIYFSSDFKLRGSEVRHKVPHIKKYAPVDFLFVDSTGALHEGETADEREVDEALASLLRRVPGRVFITTFASQIERIKNIVRTARQLSRPVGFLGRSLRLQWEAAYRAREVDLPLHQHKMPSFSAQDAIWLVAGCQADKNSSFWRLTHGELPKMQLKKGDTLIFSASMIPGNEGRIYESLNLAAEAGARVIGLTPELRVHTSGHGRRGDIAKLVSYLRPRHIIPIHGDPLHLNAFLEFIDQKKFPVTVATEHCIYALGDAPHLVETVPDETCLVEPGEVHFDPALYSIRVQLAEQGICLLVLQREPWLLRALDYEGVMSEELQQKLQPELFSRISAEVARVADSNPDKREKKLTERLDAIHSEFLAKTPRIKFVYLDDY